MLNTYLLKNKNNMQVRVLNLGASLISVTLPNGLDVCLNYSNLEDYISKPAAYLGNSVGPVAGRIANAEFTLEETTYHLDKNYLGKHTLHSGKNSLAQVIWDGETIDNKITCSYLSIDNQSEFPGNTRYTCIYTLDDNNKLTIEYLAISDSDTPINITNHVYWNLSGEKDILNHELQIHSDQYIVTDNELIPTGEIAKVTPALDFQNPKLIGKDIEQVSPGYDHCYVLKKHNLKECFAEIYAEKTKTRLRIYTTQPGAQFYTGNYLNQVGLGQYQGFCLETQNYPDAIHHANFPNCILSAGKKYHETTVFEFC